MQVAALKRRHISDLEAAISSLKDGLAAFHGIRPELVRNIKKEPTGG